MFKSVITFQNLGLIVFSPKIPKSRWLAKHTLISNYQLVQANIDFFCDKSKVFECFSYAEQLSVAIFREGCDYIVFGAQFTRKSEISKVEHTFLIR